MLDATGLRLGLFIARSSRTDPLRARAPQRPRHRPLLPCRRISALLCPEAEAVALLVDRCLTAGLLAPGLIHPTVHVDLTTTDALMGWLFCLFTALPAGAAAYFASRSMLESQETWRRVREEQEAPKVEEKILYGVDVSQSKFLMLPTVEAAVHFAALAHKDQMRLTGKPYVTHCIHTGLIFEELLTSFVDDSRAEVAAMAAVLHDVLDDTNVTVEEVKKAFGPEVGDLVQQVSELSSMVQLLRRRRRVMEGGRAAEQGVEEEDLLRSTILKSAREPLVLLIKLADRLHNMRTAYALEPAKRRSVALETRSIFCRLAERLGLFALKAELEDLSFAVTQPQDFQNVYRQLCGMWGVSSFTDSEPMSSDDLSRLAIPPYLGIAGVELPKSATTYLDEPLYIARGDTLTGDVGTQRPLQETLAEGRGSSDQGTAVLDPPATSVALDCGVQGSVQGGANQYCQGTSTVPIWVEEDVPGVSGLSCDDDGIRRQGAMCTNAGPEKRVLSTGFSQPCANSSRDGLDQQIAIVDAPSQPASLPVGAPATWETLTSEDCRQMLACVNPFTSVMFTWSGPAGNKGFGLDFIRCRTEELLQEISILSFGAGYNIEVYGRVKSLYSTYKKMKRKAASIDEAYDVLALRIVVDSESNKDNSAARRLCYQLLSTVQRLWKPVRSELDDYIAVPKYSGYQSLHTSVIGPGKVPFEVQIRTRSMHVDAEYGNAAHWTYKELPVLSGQDGPQGQGTWGPKVGQPVVRIRNGSYLDGVIVNCEHNQRHLLVAVSLKKHLQRQEGSRLASMDEYRWMVDYVEAQGWYEAGQGDVNVVLEHYVLCVDGAYHKVDHYGHKQEVIARPLEPPQQAMGLARQCVPGAGGGKQGKGGEAASRIQQEINLKARYLRQMLDFCAELDLECPDSETIHVMLWPEGQIRSFPTGTTAGDVLSSGGYIEIVDEGTEAHRPMSKLVNVNNQLVHEDTQLKDGDYVVLSRDLVRI
ncbi:unnamed protein product [Ostreobium quekettii]|uniref:GTP diphosphokinase n=1 Tax=Ostreobium quekettii TaxID=121088 RepID=A0A8S1J227_9CHLO|nr:unnamed protein product [Ostreobium quekettii]|eukprot:evm.model.scf_1113EXC.2 EVM.evm.TU.scf_1113EXC.2   scf_1113EXC:10024-16563(+)